MRERFNGFSSDRNSRYRDRRVAAVIEITRSLIDPEINLIGLDRHCRIAGRDMHNPYHDASGLRIRERLVNLLLGLVVQAVRYLEEPRELLVRDRIALAGRLFEARTIDDRNATVRVSNIARPLQRGECYGYPRASAAQHHRKIFVRQ
jgi:hypothetical protein